MAGSLASINIKFFADLKDFSTKMQNSQRQIKKMGGDMKRMGGNLSVGLTAPMAAFAAVSLKNWNDQEKAIAQVNAGLKSTGNAVGYTSEQLQQMATDLQNNTLFGDEEILKGATAQLLTFTNISGQQFARTQQAALDLATRLDGDLKSASIQLGKALNDPVANLSALSRSGIQFSTEQKTLINALWEAGDAAGAQTLILNELEKQYGGSAAAAAAAGTGPLKQLSNILGDLSEDFGAIIAEALLPFIAKIKEWALAFKALSPETKKVIAVVAGLAAAIGPVLVALGFLMTSVIPGLITVFGALTGPIGLIIAGLAAVGVVIYKNWAPIKQTLVDIANYFIDLYNESTVFRIAVEYIAITFKNMWAVAKFVFKALWSLVKGVAGFIANQFKYVGGIIKSALTFDGAGLKDAILGLRENTKKTFGDLIGNLKTDFKGLTTDVGDNIKTALENVTQRTKIKILPKNVDTTEAEKKVKNIVTTTTPTGGGNTRPKATSIQGNVEGVDESMFSSIPESLKINTDLATEHLDNLQGKMTFFQENAGIFSNAVGDAFGAMAGSIINSIDTGSVFLDAFVKSILNALSEIASAFIQQLIVEKIFGAGKKVVDMGKASSNAIVTATNAAAAMGPVGVVALPGLIASQIGIVQGAFASIAAFASGGIVDGSSYYGDKILARVNSGELILNNNQQKALYGQLNNGGGVSQVPYIAEAKIAGSDLKLVLSRQNKRDNRT